MTMVKIMFYLLGFIVLASALFIAASKNLVRTIFMFFVTLMALAGLYVLALADFIAITQIVVYVGGVLVLMIFAFMLSGRETLANLEGQKNHFVSISKLPAFVLAIAFFIVMVNILFRTDINALPWVKNAIAQKNVITPNDAMTGNIGVSLVTHYLLPFEILSILLLAALVGAAHISRKEQSA